MTARKLRDQPATFAVLLAVICLGAGCLSPESSSSDTNGQIWALVFNDSGSAPHPQTIKVYIAPFTTSSTWGEPGGGRSPGLWMYGPDGVCKYRLMVGGNSFHDSPRDRFDCVNLSASGCGMQTMGTCSFSINGNYPDATEASGTYSLTTQSPLGTASGTNSITGFVTAEEM